MLAFNLFVKVFDLKRPVKIYVNWVNSRVNMEQLTSVMLNKVYCHVGWDKFGNWLCLLRL